MKLYEWNTKKCMLMKTDTAEDGEGGYRVNCTDIREFDAAVVRTGRREMRIGEKKRSLGLYSVTVPLDDSGFTLSFGDRFRTLDDGRIYIVTGECEIPPASSVIGFMKTEAEAWIGEETE